MKGNRDSILVIPDLHAPYNHKDAIPFLRDVSRTLKPCRVACIGDEIDQHTLSRFTSDPDLLGTSDELARATEFLRELSSLFPRVSVCTSNHTYRAAKRAMEAGIPAKWLKSPQEVLGLPRTWVYKDTWVIGEVRYMHGEGFGGRTPALDAAERYGESVVLGHTHSAAGVSWVTRYTGRLYGLSTGCLIDSSAAAFAYAKHQARRPTLGCGIIVAGKPQFVPL